MRVETGSPASTVVDLRPLDSGGTAVLLRAGSAPVSEVLERINRLC
jgi:hypothetical protein